MNAPRPVDRATPQGVRRDRFRYSPSLLPGLQRATDAAMIVVAAALSGALVHGDPDELRGTPVLFHLFVSFSVMTYGGLYDVNAIVRAIRRLDDVAIALISSALLFYSVMQGLDAADRVNGAWLIAFFGLSLVTVLLGRAAVTIGTKQLSRRGLLGHTVVVFGTGAQARRMLKRVRTTRPYFIRVEGVFYDQDEPVETAVEGYPVLGDANDLLRFARGREVDDVVVALPWSADQRVAATVEQLKELPLNVYLCSDLVGFELAFRPVMGSFHDTPLFEVVQRPISGWSSTLKMIEDYVITTVVLILLAPLLALIAIAIKLDSPGPVFFTQPRLGFNNREFRIYKFRSMFHGAGQQRQVVQATWGDPRVTRVGRVLRASSFDELPQLLNVLNGTMSLVGPRPHALNHNEEYGRSIRGYFARHKVRPGITGWAQVNGLRGETESLQKMEQRIRCDVYYAENWSLMFDMRILFMTGILFLFQKSAY